MARVWNALGILLVLLTQAAAAQAPEDGRNGLDPRRGADPDRPLSPSEYWHTGDERNPGEPFLPRIITGSDPGPSPSELSQADDSARDPIEPFLPRMITGSAPGLSPSELWHADDSARGPIEPLTAQEAPAPDLFVPQMGTAPELHPGTTTPRTTGPREQFATKHARYVPVSWEELPGWREAATLGAWSAFAQGCAVLSRRQAWRETCERASVLRPATAAVAREFFEREFEAFQIRTVDRADTGTLTGYYEPSLDGSRVRTARFRHPVYAVPEDLLFLDARLVASRRPPAYVRLDGRDVVPVDENTSPTSRNGDPKVYRLAVAAIPASLRDGKIRVRRSGDRIVPYFTRQEIERNGLAAARPIAWVDDADLLYALHVEGSGRIRLANGEVLRVAFGEQNGHRFRPTVFVEPAQAARAHDASGQSRSASAPSGSPGLQRVVDFFVSPAAASESATTVTTPDQPYPRPPSEGPRVVVSSATDPSYVFFRQIPNTDSGPPGAMGVPLTAGSSLAVDPRVTPLGAPVFVAARQSGSGDTVNRLMVAQDTGGAIRGALRADYFLGSGPAAGATAMRMKDELRMWILLPKQLAIASRHAASARGSGGANCLLPDPEFCND